jgi:hypothetical protein
MGTELTISGGGSLAVSTDELNDLTQRLETAADAARSARWILTRVVDDGEAAREHSSTFSLEARHLIDRAIVLVTQCEHTATVASQSLRLASVAYGVTETSVEAIIRRLAGTLGYGLGLLSPLLLALTVSFAITATPGLLVGAGALRLWSLLDPRGFRDRDDEITEWLSRHQALLTDPLTVSLIANLLTSTDEFGSGLVRIPPPFAEVLGEDGAGVLGISTSALAAVLVGGQGGFLLEGPVSAQRTTTRILRSSPRGLAARVDRLPDPGKNAHGEQIRIDRFSTPGQLDSFEVFIAGTVDFAPRATGEPFDLTSNLRSIAQLPSGSDSAVRQAMQDAGITAHSPVVFTGHSQGGMIAANLAASGEFNTQGVVTIGAPDGAIVIEATVPVISIAHTDDLVPVLNGPRQDQGTIVVERQAFAGRAVPHDSVMPAHDRSQYRQTARMADQAATRNLSEAISRIDRMTQGSQPVSTSLYLARRTGTDSGH